MPDTDTTRGGPSISMPDILAACEKARNLPRPEFDSLICLRLDYEALRGCFVRETVLVPPLYAMFIYPVDTVAEAFVLADLLRRNGRRPAVITFDPWGKPCLSP